jgi:hypothetical protein
VRRYKFDGLMSFRKGEGYERKGDRRDAGLWAVVVRDLRTGAFDEGFPRGERVVVCQATWPEREVLFPVKECSGYVSKGRQRLRDMEEIAWTLVPRGPKRKAGFVAPTGDEEEEREIELVLKEEEE